MAYSSIVYGLRADGVLTIKTNVNKYTGAADYPCFRGLLKQLVGPLNTQLSDRRSSIVKQVCTIFIVFPGADFFFLHFLFLIL